MAKESKSDSKPNLRISMICQRDEMQHSAHVAPMTESDCRGGNDIGVFIGQQADQFRDRLVQESAITPTQLGQDIRSDGSILGILASAVLKADLKLLPIPSIVNSRQTRDRFFITISSSKSSDDAPTGSWIAFTLWIVPRHGLNLSMNWLHRPATASVANRSYAKIPFTTSPYTSVRRKSRPA